MSEMRPSKNAFLGYTYQQCITYLLLVKMDAERQIDKLEIEASVNNNFDDINLSISDQIVFCQIKDIDNIKLDDLVIDRNQITIKGRLHKLSENTNIVFFKHIEIDSINSTILEFPAYQQGNLYIVSLSRYDSLQIIEEIYEQNRKRESVISQFFNLKLDKRNLIISKEELPTIDIYNIQLSEKTINVGKKLLEFDDILFIEGKPGVGKSHLVTCLSEEYKGGLIYRFWISNQDKNYDSRLLFRNFIANTSKELFHDYRYRSEDEIIEYLSNKKKVVIIDGLDHVENYKSSELELFISFIDKLKGKTRVIVLSRPLKREITWKKQLLVNWNFEETKLVLGELYHITDYSTCKSIYEITDGYPILVRFVTEQYKNSGQIQSLGKLKSINDYYDKIISSVNAKTALALFISCSSYIMKSELSIFLEDELADIINEFINDYPHLFEIKLNRISLFHDSLNTYLIQKGLNKPQRQTKVKQIVYNSLVSGEKRFMSRLASFNLEKIMKLEIIRKYANMDFFSQLIKDCIDFEAVRAFYNQLRELLPEFEADQFDIYIYYDLSLIITILARDFPYSLKEFLYTYVKCLLFNGYGDDDITSSEYLFGMYYYYKTTDAILLYNIAIDEHYDPEHFYQDLEEEIWKEENYFNRHRKPLRRNDLKGFLSKEYISFDSFEHIPHLLTNIYIHNTDIEELKGFYHAIYTYIHIDENQGIWDLEKELAPYKSVNAHSSRYFLSKAKEIILSLDVNKLPAEYLTYTLKDLILKNSHKGSFNVWPKVLNYIRLSLHQNRKIDLSNIYYFFMMYHQRKDITVISIDEALKIFEDKGFVDIETALDTVVFTQSMSEKGIRHLLCNYITLHSPNIIPVILNKYHPDKLQITWFNLPKEHIDFFPDSLFNYALYKQLLYWNNHSKSIKFDEIKNVLFSNRKLELIRVLNTFKYQITVNKDNLYKDELQKLGCSLCIEPSDENDKYRTTIEDRYHQGILDSDSIDFIKEKKLNVTEIAGYNNGNYSVFSDIDIFKAYEKTHVKANALEILKNALIGRIKTIDVFASLFHLLGNLPKFVDEYNIDAEYDRLYNSFKKFMELSSLCIDR